MAWTPFVDRGVSIERHSLTSIGTYAHVSHETAIEPAPDLGHNGAF